jgi:hypothetical protein
MTTLAPKPNPISDITKNEIIQALSEKLKACYIFPDIAEEICIRIQKYLQAGEYEDINEGDFFAYALTLHLQEVNHDEHLWVRWHPESLPEDEGQLRLNPQWQEQRKLEARLDNHGLHKVERLPGNIGYLDFHYLHRPAWGGETVAAAMNLVSDTNALIIDLRNCTGGYPGMIALVCSYLFGEKPLHLVSIYWRDEDITQQYWTLPYVPGKLYLDKPVYVLISRITFSGGEGLANILQSRQRATLLGEKTDGGANPGVSYRLHPHFECFIPIGRTIDPLTGSNWEGVGITPDISIPQEQAYRLAYHMALETVISGVGESPSDAFMSLLDEARTALKKLDTGQ